MSKRLGFKPRYIRSQQSYKLSNDNYGSGTFGTLNNYRTVQHKQREGFDLVNKTFSNKVYVCVDKDTKKYAMSFDDTDASYISPVIVKPVNLHDKSQWITSDAGAGVLNFFYSLKNYLHIELERNKELGDIIPIMRSDLWENAFFKFGDDNEIIVDFNKGGKSAKGSQYCLAFRKEGLDYSGEPVDTLATKWNDEYKFFDPSTVKNYDDSGNKTTPTPTQPEPTTPEPTEQPPATPTNESFISRMFNYVWKPIQESFFVKETMEPETPAAPTQATPAKVNKSGFRYLELVELDNIDESVWSYKWVFQEVWDMRTATNIALETKQINDLEEIDKEALDNIHSAYDKLKYKYEQEKQFWANEKADYDSHFMTKFY